MHENAHKHSKLCLDKRKQIPKGILQVPGASLIPMLCRGQGVTYTNVLSDINIFFTAVYLAEAVLKNTAFGPWKYIKDNW